MLEKKFFINTSIEKCFDATKNFERSELYHRFEFENIDTYKIQYAQVPRDTARGRYIELQLSTKPGKFVPRIKLEFTSLTKDSCLLSVNYSFFKGLICFCVRNSFIPALIVLFGIVTDISFLWVLFGILFFAVYTGVFCLIMLIDKNRFIKHLVHELNKNN